ncbi:glycosyltransferase family 4 protein [Anaerosalibacter massiliensis]|uniref:Glycosyltransferase family 4 protein n=1 Tax=Anaerosalibacter massiliensis TaxID=1347392 RepID=A0A9X2S6G7_9FIRM|nr:glycosyltransferase family 4 protein [Anaerosalibacter massiliensis]MCR2045359.1 glycosyltransferase family 4 protein [Anaerosalibacter massiliensis]
MRKDVLILCQYFYPEYISSATLPTELAEDLVKKGLSVDVLCGYPKEFYNDKKIAKNEVYKGINIRRVKYTALDNKTKFGRIINFFSFFMSVLFKLHSITKYKCIIVYSNPPILPLIPYFASRISKTKFIFVAFDVYPDSALILGAIKKGSIIEKIMSYINKRVYNNASKVVALGTEMKRYMLENNITNRSDIIEVIPNWYNGEKLIKQNIIFNKEFKRLRETFPFIVLYSGNMGLAQDMKTILRCMDKFKNNDNVLFVFTGNGNKVEHVKNYIKDNKIKNAKVYGFLLGEDYSDVLKMADACLVSLERGIEGIGVPSKTYGYLAAGKPVLAIMSDDTDIARKLNEYNAGGNVIQDDIEGLEELILKFINDKELLDICSKNAKRLFNDLYERQICTEMYYKMILEVLRNKKEFGDEVYVQR